MGFFSKPEVIGPHSGNDIDRSRLAELERRVAQLEAQIALLAATPGGAVAAAAATASSAASSSASVAAADAAPAAEPWLAQVQQLRRAGKTIHAIKVYRDHTGVGLKEAKDAVEAMPG